MRLSILSMPDTNELIETELDEIESAQDAIDTAQDIVTSSVASIRVLMHDDPIPEPDPEPDPIPDPEPEPEPPPPPPDPEPEPDPDLVPAHFQNMLDWLEEHGQWKKLVGGIQTHWLPVDSNGDPLPNGLQHHIHWTSELPFMVHVEPGAEMDLPTKVVLFSSESLITGIRVDAAPSGDPHLYERKLAVGFAELEDPIELDDPNVAQAWLEPVVMETDRLNFDLQNARFRITTRTHSKAERDEFNISQKRHNTSSEFPYYIGAGTNNPGNMPVNPLTADYPYWRGKGWYDDGIGYHHADIEVPDGPVSGMWTFHVRVGKRPRDGAHSLVVALNQTHSVPAVGTFPAIAGNPGVELLRVSNPEPLEWIEVVVDTTKWANGGHKISVTVLGKETALTAPRASTEPGTPHALRAIAWHVVDVQN